MIYLRANNGFKITHTVKPTNKLSISDLCHTKYVSKKKHVTINNLNNEVTIKNVLNYN